MLFSHSKFTSLFVRSTFNLLSFIGLCCGLLFQNCLAIDSFDPSSGVLTIPFVQAADKYYKNVQITIGKVVSVGKQNKTNASFDSYDISSNQLSIPTVTSGDKTYYNVVVTVGNVIVATESCYLAIYCDQTSSSVNSPVVSQIEFDGSILLGSPTDTGIDVSVLSKQQSGLFYISYGTNKEQLTNLSKQIKFEAGIPATVGLDGLNANSQYFFQLIFVESNLEPTPLYQFRTARNSGETFTFTVQADSHLDENSNLDQYYLTLSNVLVDKPDFHIDLGDTFMTEKYSEPFTSLVKAAPDFFTVTQRYQYERHNFGTITHSIPLYLVNGNHDGELGWLKSETTDNLPIWATEDRLKFFLNPKPSQFYSGDTSIENLIGQRSSWYAWTWGDALFVVLDPFWNSAIQPNQNGWNLTLGLKQYQWLEDTLSTSNAKYKFVFIHNLVGGLDGQMRGGIEAAPYYEWGGKNLDGTNGFSSHRPGWNSPIHDLLVKNKVSAVFHGHDHVYVKQNLDGIVYQTVPQPSAVNNTSGTNIAKSYHYVNGTILSSSGHIRVTVSPTGITSEYIRSWLPSSQNASRQNRSVDDVWYLSP